MTRFMLKCPYAKLHHLHISAHIQFSCIQNSFFNYCEPGTVNYSNGISSSYSSLKISLFVYLGYVSFLF